MGDVMKDKVVATLINAPISDLRNIKITSVPMERINNHQLYDPSFLQPNRLNVFPVALGEASMHARVVLNIVIKAATAINTNILLPKVDVYNWIS